MRRRDFLGVAGGAVAFGQAVAGDCGCGEPFTNQAAGAGGQARLTPAPAVTAWQTGDYDRILSKVRITNVKVFGVTYDTASDRPYVFVKLETNAGVVGWGEAT